MLLSRGARSAVSAAATVFSAAGAGVASALRPGAAAMAVQPPIRRFGRKPGHGRPRKLAHAAIRRNQQTPLAYLEARRKGVVPMEEALKGKTTVKKSVYGLSDPPMVPDPHMQRNEYGEAQEYAVETIQSAAPLPATSLKLDNSVLFYHPPLPVTEKMGVEVGSKPAQSLEPYGFVHATDDDLAEMRELRNSNPEVFTVGTLSRMFNVPPNVVREHVRMPSVRRKALEMEKHVRNEVPYHARKLALAQLTQLREGARLEAEGHIARYREQRRSMEMARVEQRRQDGGEMARATSPDLA